MLPLWILDKQKKKQKEQFIQEELRIEELPPLKKEDKEDELDKDRGVIIIDLF